jgi:hypothetical protein
MEGPAHDTKLMGIRIIWLDMIASPSFGLPSRVMRMCRQSSSSGTRSISGVVNDCICFNHDSLFFDFVERKKYQKISINKRADKINTIRVNWHRRMTRSNAMLWIPHWQSTLLQTFECRLAVYRRKQYPERTRPARPVLCRALACDVNVSTSPEVFVRWL